MIVIACTRCQLALRVLGDPNEVEHLLGKLSPFWPDRYACARCGAAAHCAEEQVCGVEVLASVVDLTPQEAYVALHGLGLPEERRCTKAALIELLREQPVRRVIASDIQGVERCYLEQLELWDGTRIHLGAGPGGAVVYRITRPISYAERVLDGQP